MLQFEVDQTSRTDTNAVDRLSSHLGFFQSVRYQKVGWGLRTSVRLITHPKQSKNHFKHVPD
jgi:hypothetical protein